MYDIPRVLGETANQPMFYSATNMDYRMCTGTGILEKTPQNPAEEPYADLWVCLPFLLLDLPISFAYDTLLLPFDCGYYVYYRNREKKMLNLEPIKKTEI